MRDDDIRLGSILLWPRRGPLAGILAPAIKHFDSDPWVRENWREWWHVWHTAQVVGYDPFYGWIIDEVVAGKNETWRRLGTGDFWVEDGLTTGDRRVPLDDVINERGKPRVINWVQVEVSQEKCDRFIESYAADRYDGLDYLWVILSRITRGRFPRIINRYQYCWARTAKFAAHCGWPWSLYYEMPFMPVLTKESALRRASK